MINLKTNKQYLKKNYISISIVTCELNFSTVYKMSNKDIFFQALHREAVKKQLFF